MHKYILVLLAVFITANSYAQQATILKIISSRDSAAVAGATIRLSKTSSLTSDSNGIVKLNLPVGKNTLTISAVNFKELTFKVPALHSNETPLLIILEEMGEEMEEVIIQSTRTSRTFQNSASRIETIDAEELDEKTNMRPSNVSMLLHESTGIQVQQTSATSGNASIRIQGLDGRYTQVLKDGYPSFGNFAAGLSILEIPPLDLQQVEIIKGPASTLFGAGAIAGVINFISKTPGEKRTTNLLFNQSNVGQTNAGIFSMKRNKKIGYSVLALYNNQKAFDVDKDDFTELPDATDFTLNPKLFIYPSDKTSIVIGNSFSKAERTGGDVFVLRGEKDNFHRYFEKNKTLRNTTTINYNQELTNAKKLTLKSAFNYFNRKIGLDGYEFKGKNYNVFTDASYVQQFDKQVLVAGVNYIYDHFKEVGSPVLNARNFTTSTIGLYGQYSWDITKKLKTETGLRTDRVHYFNSIYKKDETFVLPRLSVLYIFNQHWSSRVTAGLGYKTPTIFTEATETFQYRNVAGLNGVRSERSQGITADLSFKKQVVKNLNFSVNQLFFITMVNRPTILQQAGIGNYFFVNSGSPLRSQGFETNAKLIFKDAFKLFAGYTFTNSKAGYLTGNQYLPLQPRDRINLALVYERERYIKIGLEGYRTGIQYLTNGSATPSYWEFGLMAEKTFNKLSIFINAENFTDERQSNYKKVFNEPHSNPTFDEIWNHTEGRTLNAGIKYRF